MAASTQRSPLWHLGVVRFGVRVLGAVIGLFVAWNSLHVFFMLLAALMVVLALAALFQSLRTAFGDASGVSGLRVSLPERAALVDEKNALLRAIKDIAYERAVGKLSDADFERLDRAYRHRAKEVLRKLDEDLAPFLERAEKLVGEPAAPPAARAETGPRKKSKKKKEKAAPRRDCPSCGTSNPADAEHCKECGARVAPVACEACGTSNDADAKFCKKCAAPLAKPAPEAPEPAAPEPAATESAATEIAEGEDA